MLFEFATKNSPILGCHGRTPTCISLFLYQKSSASWIVGSVTIFMVRGPDWDWYTNRAIWLIANVNYSHQFLCLWDEQIMSADVGCCAPHLKERRWTKKIKNFWGHDAMKGSRRKFKKYNSCIPGSGVCTYDSYYERQFETAFFQLGHDQTRGPCQKFFFDAKVLR